MLPQSADIRQRCFSTFRQSSSPQNHNSRRLQVPLGVALAELSPAGVRALVAAAALLSAPEGLGASVLLRRGMLGGALALLAPAHLTAVVREQPGGTRS